MEDQKKEQMPDQEQTAKDTEKVPDEDISIDTDGPDGTGKEAAQPEGDGTDSSAAADESAGADTDDSDQSMEKKTFFKKKKDKKDEQIEELTNQIKRTMAEFDNYRKRTEKEKSAMYEVGARSVLEKLLPIVDNFERGLATLEEEQKQEPFAVGMDKTYQLLQKMMEDLEVKPIEALGKEFDPGLHNAVMHVEDEEAGENIVVEEFQKGYTYRDNVIRHSMVKVAN